LQNSFRHPNDALTVVLHKLREQALFTQVFVQVYANASTN